MGKIHPTLPNRKRYKDWVILIGVMREWISEIDGLRGVAILAVIVIHSVANFSQIDTINKLLILNLVIDVFSHFAVPLFIFISGYVLSSKYQQVTITYYIKRIKSVVLPYITFSFFYLFCSTLYNANCLHTPSTACSRVDMAFYGSYY